MEKRKKTLLILGLCIFTLTLIGLSYAFWQITLQQTDENVVYTSCLQFDFTDENDIHLLNAYPMTEEEQTMFFESETPYHFTITNECANKANLSINLEVLPVRTDETQLDDEWVDVVLYEGNEKINVDETTILNQSDENGHYKLTASDVNDNRLLEESEKAYTLHNFTIEKNETKDFSMYLLLDEDTPLETEEGKKTTNAHWKGKVTINAAYKKPDKGMLRKINSYYNFDLEQMTSDEKGMWQYKDQITKIVIEKELTPHEDAVYQFDESAEEDGSVKSYLVENGQKKVDEYCDEETEECEMITAYIAYIQADGKVKANYDSSYLFADFGYVTEIEGLENLDTSKTENMSFMFSFFNYNNDELSLIKTLDVSSLDTSQVTNMSYMFSNMYLLTELTLGDHFDTSKVTDMSGMFNGTPLTELNLPETFNTSNVTDMNHMFGGINVTELNLPESFNTSNVTNMSYMFYWMKSLTVLNLGEHFDTSQVTNMSYMFNNTSSLDTLDLSKYNFDTSHVTNMNGMFEYMEKLTELNLGDKFNTSNVTDMGSMFMNMSSLDTLDLSKYNFDTSHVTEMSSMFRDMTLLTQLNLGKHFDTSNVDGMFAMFRNDSNLTLIEYGKLFIHKKYANIYDMFYNCPPELNKPNEETHESWKDVIWN